jgi:hypothetical protein
MDCLRLIHTLPCTTIRILDIHLNSLLMDSGAEWAAAKWEPWQLLVPLDAEATAVLLSVPTSRRAFAIEGRIASTYM